MSDIRVNALNIRAVDYSEGDKLLTLLTYERGRITAKIRSVKAPKSKLKYAASPFTFGEYLLAYKNGRYTVCGCDLKESFSNISSDYEKFYSASALNEACYRLTKDNLECRELISCLLTRLKVLNYTDIFPALVAADGLLKILALSGYSVIGDGCAVCGSEDCGYFSLSSGGTVCKEHSRDIDIKVSAKLTDLLKKISYSDIGEINADRQTVIEALNLISGYFTYQTDAPLKSVSGLIAVL